MTIVVKLGGTNGSGKTSVARALMTEMGGGILPLGYIPNSKKISGYGGLIGKDFWSILGSYETTCGGMDTISDKNVRLDLIKSETSNKQNSVVFFEGLITGKTYGAIGELSETQKANKWIYAFMDTPFEVCVERVMQRRAEKDKDRKWGLTPKPFDPERTMRPTFKSVQAVAKRAAAQGHAVLWLPHALAPYSLVQYLLNYMFKNPALRSEK